MCMFRPVPQVAAPGAKSAVSDCILFCTVMKCEVKRHYQLRLPFLWTQVAWCRLCRCQHRDDRCRC